MKKFLYAAVAATAFISSAAMATVTFDPTSGTGFVGKGDVQLAFGWNNAAAQKYSSQITFTYQATDTYDVTCQFDTPSGGTHTIVNKKHTSVNDTVQYDARIHNQIDGYYLTGFGSTSSDGTVPSVGDTCPGHSELGTVTDVELVGSSGDGDGLYVNWNSNSVLIWP